MGPALREPVAEGRADFIPVFLSEVPELFLSGRIRLDAALLQLSPPNRHGHTTLGTSVDAAMAATVSARMVFAEINEQMPRTLGHSVVPLSRVTAYTRTNRALAEHVVERLREQGYRGIQFNAVVETNTVAVRLWQDLGFRIIGTVPEAFDSASHGLVGLHVMYRDLT